MAKKVVKSRSKTVKKAGFNKREFSLFILAFAIIGAFTLWVSLAAPHNSGGSGGKGSTDSLTLKMVTDKNGDGLPNFGDTVTFGLSTASTYPYVRVTCNQNGALVYTETNGFFTSYPWDDNYDLGPTQTWTGGAANCTAQLIVLSSNGRQNVTGTLNFSVGA